MIEREEIVSRRSALPLTYCQRWELPDGSPVGTSLPRALLREVRRFDRDLELYWHPVRQRWLLYRVLRRSPVSCDDYLVMEYELEGPRGEYRPPGAWLIDWMRKHDKYRGGSVDPRQAFRSARSVVDRIKERQMRENEARAADWAKAFHEEADRYAVRQTHSQDFKWSPANA